MKVKLIIISIILLLVMVFACGCLPFMENIGLINPTDEEQLSPEKGGPPDGLVKVLIGFKEKPGPPEQALVKGLGGKIKYTYNLIPAIAASVPEVAIGALQKNPNITNVELDNQVYALEDTTQIIPWGVDRIDAEVVHISGNTWSKGVGVDVAIIDTGIDCGHEDLIVAGGKSFVKYTTEYDDDNGHGTHVAGIVAALDNDIGVVGVAPAANLYALKVLDGSGIGYVSDVIFAIQWATDPNGNGYAEDRLDIINMSLGASRGNIFLKWACNLAYRDGLLLVAAAGNEEGGPVIYPAAYSSVIAVSATNKEDNLADFSSIGSKIELAAPGDNIYSTCNGSYDWMSGTSMASPHVAGAAALVWAANLGWTNDDVRAQLQDTADDLGDTGKDSEFGYGLVDAEGAALGTEEGNDLMPTEIHDVVITSMNAPSTVSKGDIVAVDVSVANEGTYNETFTLTLTDITDEYIIGLVENVILVAGESTTNTFNWDTVSSSLDNHILEAKASVVNGETSTTNNVKVVTVNVVDVVEKKVLYVKMDTGNTNYSLGESVYITVTVTENSGSGQIVEGASVQTEISTASGRKYTKDGITDLSGKVIFKFKIKKPDGKGTYSVAANVSKSGYESGSRSITFEVK